MLRVPAKCPVLRNLGEIRRSFKLLPPGDRISNNPHLISLSLSLSILSFLLQAISSSPDPVRNYRTFFTLGTIIFLAKLTGSVLPSFLYGMRFCDAIAFGFIMAAKSVIDEYLQCCKGQDFDEPTMAVMMISLALTGVIVPLLMRMLHDPSKKFLGYRMRNIMDLKAYNELSMVACIHKADDIPGVNNLLDTSGPTAETAISLYVLHLMELCG